MKRNLNGVLDIMGDGMFSFKTTIKVSMHLILFWCRIVVLLIYNIISVLKLQVACFRSWYNKLYCRIQSII